MARRDARFGVVSTRCPPSFQNPVDFGQHVHRIGGKMLDAARSTGRWRSTRRHRGIGLAPRRTVRCRSVNCSPSLDVARPVLDAAGRSEIAASNFAISQPRFSGPG